MKYVVLYLLVWISSSAMTFADDYKISEDALMWMLTHDNDDVSSLALNVLAQNDEVSKTLIRQVFILASVNDGKPTSYSAVELLFVHFQESSNYVYSILKNSSDARLKEHIARKLDAVKQKEKGAPR